MSEHHKQVEEQEQDNSGLLSEIRKIQQHLVFLEKKIDMLVGGQAGGGGGRPFNKERHFPKPNRPFGHSRPQRSHDGPPRGDREFGPRRPFEGGGRFDKGPRKEQGQGGGGDFPRRKKQWRSR
jgi:hypothetical protein